MAQMRAELRAIGSDRDKRQFGSPKFADLHGMISKQVFDSHAQRISQCLHRVHGWIGTATLDATHVRPRKTAFVGEGFLRQAGGHAKLSDALADFLTNVDFFHMFTVARRDIKGHALKEGAPIVTLGKGYIVKQFYATALLVLLVSGCTSLTPQQQVEKIVPDKTAPIYFTGFWTPGPNSVDGVGIYQRFINPGQKTYKYVITEYTAQNRVYDTVASSIGGKTVAGTKSVGPFPYGHLTDTMEFGPLWYNASIECVTMVRATIIYMDESVKVIEGADLKRVVPKGFVRNCSR